MGLNVFVAIRFYYVSAPEVCKPPIAKQGAKLGIFSIFPKDNTVKMFLQDHVTPLFKLGGSGSGQGFWSILWKMCITLRDIENNGIAVSP